MPIYEYACQSCGKTIDVLQKFSDPAPETCGECGAAGSLTKLVSRSSFVLKGGGWYSDLYSSTKKDGGSSDSSASSATSSTSTPSSSASTPASTSSTTSSSSSSSTAAAPAAAPAASKT